MPLDTLPAIANLRDGTEVAGKHYAGRIVPTTYANRTQADKAAAWWRAYGYPAAAVLHRMSDRPFYVRINEPKGVTP